MKPYYMWYWSLAGLLIPAMFQLVNLLVGYDFVGFSWQQLILILWPSSFFFMAIHEDVVSASVLLIWVISIGTNVILYTVIGAVVMILKGSCGKANRRMDDHATQVKLLSLIYAIYAVGGIFGIPLFLSDIYGPTFLNWVQASYALNILPLAGFINLISCAFITHGIWRSRYWGRFLAISYNSLWLAALLGGFALSITTGAPSADLGLALLLAIVFLGFPASVIAFCLRPDIKKLMC